MGKDALRVYDGLELTDAQRVDVKEILDAFEQFCLGETNETYERWIFNNRNQHDTESIDAYVGELRLLAKTCDFGTLEDSLIRDRIVCGITDQTVQKRLLQTADLKLKFCIDMCRTSEASVSRLRQMGQSEIMVVQGRSQVRGAPKSPRGRGGHPGVHHNAKEVSHKSQQSHSGANRSGSSRNTSFAVDLMPPIAAIALPGKDSVISARAGITSPCRAVIRIAMCNAVYVQQHTCQASWSKVYECI